MLLADFSDTRICGRFFDGFAGTSDERRSDDRDSVPHLASGMETSRNSLQHARGGR